MKNSFRFSMLPLTLTFAMIGCDVDQVQEGKLPTVDVDADAGRLPDYDMEGPDVDVSMDKRKVSVPDVSVDMKEKTMSTPDIDIDLPEDE